MFPCETHARFAEPNIQLYIVVNFLLHLGEHICPMRDKNSKTGREFPIFTEFTCSFLQNCFS